LRRRHGRHALAQQPLQCRQTGIGQAHARERAGRRAGKRDGARAGTRWLLRTIGSDSMVLPTAISNIAVNIWLEMICLSSRMLAKISSINPLVCNSQPTTRASPCGQPSRRQASHTPSNLPATLATISMAATTNTVSAPRLQVVFRPVLRKNTGM
jgi:hypothetical protein